MRAVASLFLRGLVQVAPVAASTYFVAHDQLHYAVVTGFLISLAWYVNVGRAAHLRGLRWACVYAAGAACGTWTGQVLAILLTRS